MEILGELTDNSIIVKKPNDMGRLYNKSHIGLPQSGNVLKLNLLEAVFLLHEGKMKVFHQKKPVDLQQLVLLASRQVPEFETKYLVYKDLRNRGHAIVLCDNASSVTFRQHEARTKGRSSCSIVAFSERDILDIDVTKKLVQQVTNKQNMLWFALVDEEGDLTYYEVSSVDLAGDVSEHQYTKGCCFLLKDRVVLFDKTLASDLLQKEFFGKPFGDGLQLSFVEALFLLRRKKIQIRLPDNTVLSETKCIKIMQKLQPDIEQRLMVFDDLKQRGLIVKTGFKFGAHFRAYRTHPEKTHAEYLIHVVEKGFKSIWAEISRAVRLAHSVNKEFVFARFDGQMIDYIKLGRLRP